VADGVGVCKDAGIVFGDDIARNVTSAALNRQANRCPRARNLRRCAV